MGPHCAGFELLADRNYFKRRKEYLQKKEEEAQRAKKGDKTVFGGDSEGTDGLFGDVGEEAVTGDRLFQEDSVANGQQGKPFAGRYLDSHEAIILQNIPNYSQVYFQVSFQNT